MDLFQIHQTARFLLRTRTSLLNDCNMVLGWGFHLSNCAIEMLKGILRRNNGYSTAFIVARRQGRSQFLWSSNLE